MSVLVVTGTGTGVGKTIGTAALACHARQVGLDVAVCKPIQTGTVDGDDDLAEVGRLAGVSTLTPGWRYPEPLAPLAAAQRAGLDLPTRADLVGLITAADRPGQLTLVEGAGGLLVQLADDGATLRDLAVAVDAPVLVVSAAGLGTLNHTALTVEALGTQGLRCSGVVIGSWPVDAGPAEATNRDELDAIAPVRAVLPAGAGTLSPSEFGLMSARAFDSDWVRSLVA